MVRYKAKPHLIKLGRFLGEKVEQSGMTLNEFTGKAGIPNSTVSQIVHGYARMSDESARKISKALYSICGVKVSAFDLLAMIEDESEGVATERKPKESEIMTGSKILWHLQRLAQSDRVKLWPEVLKLAAADYEPSDQASPQIPLGRKPNMDVLIQLINAEADRHHLPDVTSFADWVMTTPAGRKDISKAIQGLIKILVERELPYQDSPIYQALIPVLAIALGFESDIKLLSYCGLKAQPEPKTVQSEANVAQ